MKITITNAYTWYNKGDAGILLGTVNALKKIYGNNIEINVLSFTPDEDRKRYCKDSTIKNVYSNILNPFPYKRTFCGKSLAILKLFLKMTKIYFWSKISLGHLSKKEKSVELLSESDMIVVCGGGFLGGKKYDSLMHLFQIYVNTLLKKPVIVMGTSIEPMKQGIIKKYTEKVLRKVDYVYAREIITYDYLKSFLPDDKIMIIPDMAFMLEDNFDENPQIQELKKQNKIVCGITVREWNFPNCDNAKEMMNKYIECMANAIDYLSEKDNITFVFVPQVIVKERNDTDVAFQIRERLKNKTNLLVLEDDFTPIEIKGIISNCDIFIGTRMHSNIFATSVNIPTIAIAYEKKTNGIMKTLDLEKFVIDIDTLKSDNLIEKTEYLLNNKQDIQNKIQNKIKQIREEIIEKLNDKMREYKK